MDRQCLICLKPLAASGDDYHPQCSKRFFGMVPAPRLTIKLKDLKRFAAESVLSRITVTGVQKKLSLGIEGRDADARFTVVGLWGGYILKPPSESYPHLPENEDAVMRLAETCGIPVVPHAFIKLASGEMAFICKRIDRTPRGEKIAMEDFCQISERLTEDKYKGSVERIGKLILRHSAYPGLDAVDFFERVLFCYITGNADMHLKNYSLIETDAGPRLSSAYDMLCTELVIPDDPDQTALTINGKKSNLRRLDFDAFAAALAIASSASRQVYRKSLALRGKLLAVLKDSLLPEKQAERLGKIITTRLELFEK